MSQVLVNKVFVPGKFPEYTYNPRTSARLESKLREVVDSGGSIACVSGLTKMGKTVLVSRLLPMESNVWVDGGRFDSIDQFWTLVADNLGIYPSVRMTSSSDGSNSAKLAGKITTPIASIGAEVGATRSIGDKVEFAADRPLTLVATETLLANDTAIVIDDFHFISRPLQREVIRHLKSPLFRGLKVVVISTSHRTFDVIMAEPNMEGRAESIEVDRWTEEELLFIAQTWFAKLNLEDPFATIGSNLAENAFGSPHLMQKFCKAICFDNSVSSEQESLRLLSAPDDWTAFFASQVDGVASRWFDRLLRGPQERGSQRTKWPRKSGGEADTYALVMEALVRAQVTFTITKDRLRSTVDSIVNGPGPATDKITRTLQQISRIAGRPLQDVVPSEDDLDQGDDGDTQFVLEYVDQGPSSKLHITDPFFAYYLRWGTRNRF